MRSAREKNSVHPEDFVCAPCKYIRMANMQEGGGKELYYFYECYRTSFGKGLSVSYLYSYQELEKSVQRKGFDIKKCPNQKGEILRQP